MVTFNKLFKQEQGIKTEVFWDVTPRSLIRTDVPQKPDISIFKAGDGGSRFLKDIGTKPHGVTFKKTVTSSLT
jgi:hypothetical protein